MTAVLLVAISLEIVAILVTPRGLLYRTYAVSGVLYAFLAFALTGGDNPLGEVRNVPGQAWISLAFGLVNVLAFVEAHGLHDKKKYGTPAD